MAKVLNLILTFIVVHNACAADSPDQQPTEIIKKIAGAQPKSNSTNWTDYLTDTAPASISAAGMLSLSGDSITTVENVRDLSVAFKSIGSGDSKGTYALSFTPARSAIFPMEIKNYVSDNPIYRILGSTTFGYAQGSATISGASYDRQAVSIQISGFFVRDEDPVIALYEAVSDGKLGCGAKDILPQVQQPPQLKTDEHAGASTDAPAASDEAKANIAAKWKKCSENINKARRWNVSTYSFGYAAGWIKPTNGTKEQETLGHTLFVGGQYGFLNPRKEDGTLDASSTQGWLVAAAYRKYYKEPVLNTLGLAQTVHKDSSITYLKVSGGTSKIRGLLEGNSTKATDITLSQRAFKIALGLDAQIYKDIWLNFRFGRQRAVDGSKEENGSLFSLSYNGSSNSDLK